MTGAGRRRYLQRVRRQWAARRRQGTRRPLGRAGQGRGWWTPRGSKRLAQRRRRHCRRRWPGRGWRRRHRLGRSGRPARRAAHSCLQGIGCKPWWGWAWGSARAWARATGRPRPWQCQWRWEWRTPACRSAPPALPRTLGRHCSCSLLPRQARLLQRPGSSGRGGTSRSKSRWTWGRSQCFESQGRKQARCRCSPAAAWRHCHPPSLRYRQQ